MVAAGIKYIADLKEDLDAPVVISLSLANYDKPTDMSVRNAIKYATDKGCIVIAAAGNNGNSGMGWPAAFSEVISCGAGGWTEMFYEKSFSETGYCEAFWRNDVKDVPEKLNTKDVWKNNKQIYVASFSSRPNKDLGQKPKDLDLSCAGVRFVVPYKQEGYWSGSAWVYPGWGYFWLSGTSLSTPVTSSIASLVLQNYPDADQADMEKILIKGATGEPFPCKGSDVSDLYWNTNGLTRQDWKGTDYGAGFLKADSALEKADAYF